MFDEKKAFASLPSGKVPYEQLKNQLSEIAWEHRRDLPPGFGSREMLEIGLERGWVRGTGDGFEVRAPEIIPPRSSGSQRA